MGKDDLGHGMVVPLLFQRQVIIPEYAHPPGPRCRCGDAGTFIFSVQSEWKMPFQVHADGRKTMFIPRLNPQMKSSASPSMNADCGRPSSFRCLSFRSTVIGEHLDGFVPVGD